MKLSQKIAIRRSIAARRAAQVETPVAGAPKARRVPSEKQRENGRRFFAPANAANAARRAEKAAQKAAEQMAEESLAA